MSFRIEAVRDGTAVRVHLAKGPAVVILYELITPRGRIPPRTVTVEGGGVRAEGPLGTVRDELCTAADGALEIHRVWELATRAPVRLPCVVELEGTFSEWVVPAVMVDGNHEGAGRFPRGGLDVGWSFREDRCPIPSCAILAGDAGAWAFFSLPARTEEEIGSIRSKSRQGFVELEIATPYEESPSSYREKGVLIGGLHGPRRAWFHPAPASDSKGHSSSCTPRAPGSPIGRSLPLRGAAAGRKDSTSGPASTGIVSSR